ncbi:nicotinate-nucleotide adenylyltransferase [Marinimicrobium koreense]|uniref:nicotinate-nucleotide adenylyltransferase n=1 Tax=Marinimicrobium koreense TaxID=306545 RepID=UPI003F7254CF
MTQAIGLLGGTFDPIHLGHLRMALEAGETLALDEVRLLPCHQPPHRATPDVSSVERTEMLRLALADCPSLVLDDRELHRDGPSYTLDTLKSLRAELGPAVPLIWILGCDAFLGLEQWYGWRELLDWGHLLVIARPGWELPSRGPLAEWLSEHQVAPEALTASPAGAIGVQALRLLPISATEIRSLIQAGRSPQFLLPDAVWQYIRDNNLYRARA